MAHPKRDRLSLVTVQIFLLYMNVYAQLPRLNRRSCRHMKLLRQDSAATETLGKTFKQKVSIIHSVSYHSRNLFYRDIQHP
jgi:hypothetical protein